MKRSYILDIEKQISERWYSVNYHDTEIDLNKSKYFATFPYPYMNGYLHLGHAFTMCKVDFTCRYKKLCGYNVLFPFGFHCTGMPICGAAKRLEKELDLYTADQIQNLPETDENKKLQYNILKSYNLLHEDIVEFIDPNHWLTFFPKRGLKDIKAFNTFTDLRRSFITTQLNPFYDSFVKYQFTKLQKNGFLKHGIRQSVYSPTLDIQCQDHDRLKGEGVAISEYKLVEIELDNSNIIFLACVKLDQTKSDKNKSDQINNMTILLLDLDSSDNVLCEFLPSYYRFNKKYICSKYLMENMHAQNIMTEYDIVQPLSDETKQLLKSDLKQRFKLVPSESLQISESMKKHTFESVSYAKLFGFVCKCTLMNSNTTTLNTESINKLTEFIHLLDDIVIDRSNNQCIVKPLPQWYISYSDPEWKAKTISLVEQQMIDVPNSDLKQILISNINKLNDWGVSRQFGLGTHLPCDDLELIDSLSDSTIYPAFYTIAHLIQSDIYGSPCLSTITAEDFTYEVWDWIFCSDSDVLISDKLTETNIDFRLLNQMKESFNYWYPVDLRISGKDLLTNHLVMYLYNHSAIFRDKHFPKTIYANGWIMVDGKKMSKSEGNFITINQLIGNESIDSIRMTLADSGDGIDDANYVRSNASDSNLLKLYDWVKMLSDVELKFNANVFRTNASSYAYIDELFNNIIKWQIRKTQIAYEEFKFRDVLIEMFYSFNNLREKYRIWCKLFNLEPHIDIINLFNKTQTIYMNPIIPHVTEYVWLEIFKSNNMMYQFATKLSLIQTQGYNTKIISDYEIISDLIKQIQGTISRNSKRKNYTFGKIIIKCVFEIIDVGFITELFEKLFGSENNKIIIELSVSDQWKKYSYTIC
jgi:leucyl-tRNA synthetase